MKHYIHIFSNFLVPQSYEAGVWSHLVLQKFNNQQSKSSMAADSKTSDHFLFKLKVQEELEWETKQLVISQVFHKSYIGFR